MKGKERRNRWICTTVLTMICLWASVGMGGGIVQVSADPAASLLQAPALPPLTAGQGYYDACQAAPA